MKKRILAVVCACALTVSMLMGCGGKEESGGSGGDSGDTIKIGTLYPLTGDVASIGQNIMRGVEFAVDEINEKGGIDGKQIEIVQGDSAGDTKTGMAEAERLITQENVVAILGAYQSSVTEVVAQVTDCLLYTSRCV